MVSFLALELSFRYQKGIFKECFKYSIHYDIFLKQLFLGGQKHQPKSKKELRNEVMLNVFSLLPWSDKHIKG
jgi:hypothetical protein